MYKLEESQFSLLDEAVEKGWQEQRVRALVGEVILPRHICKVSPTEHGKGGGWIFLDV